MIYDHLEFHNISQMVHADGCDEKILSRVPEDLFSSIAPATALQFCQPSHGEIRFKTTAFPVELYLTVYHQPAAVSVYFGDYHYRTMVLPAGPQTIRLEQDPGLEQFFSTAPDGNFSSKLIRVIFLPMNSMIAYRGWKCSAELTPPSADDLPGHRYLAYGTSITHGMSATTPVTAYAYQAATRMGADLFNLGTAGAAYLEPELGEYLAQNYDFDIFTGEISVNMLNQGYTDQQFYDRSKAFLTAIDRAHPNALKAVFSILPYFADLGITRPAMVSTPERFREILKALAEEFQGRYLFLDGKKLLHFNHLAFDMIHPGDLGGIELGENLAKRLMEYAPEFFSR